MVQNFRPHSPKASLVFLVLTSVSALALMGCGGTGSEDTTTSSTASTGFNFPPRVDAGPDLMVDEAMAIQIDATITDTEDTPTIVWTQLTGPQGSFDDNSLEDPIFNVPRIDQDLSITLRVTADDGRNPAVSDEVTLDVINVRTENTGPSSQGITVAGDQRRDNANANRRNGPPVFGSFEARSYDGSGNNLANPSWGQSFIHLRRISDADYGNGYDSLAGQSRPSARFISNAIIAQADGASVLNPVNATDMVWQWGQFIDHDIDLTDGAELSANIVVPTGDPYFDPEGTGTAVIPFNRAIFDPETGTDVTNPREQENEITSWIDASMVYGSDSARAMAVREGENSPYLATSSGNLLPFNTQSLSNANGFIPDPTALFLAGDVRANEQLGLTVMHTLFVREHNRRARMLAAENPQASADEVFEETRRWVAGLIQKITYRDWLPVFVGPDALGPYPGYNARLNASIYNEFSVAAFRLGHSMINEQIWRLDADGNEIAEGHVDLARAFFSGPSLLQDETDIDPILRGLATQRHQAIDHTIIHDLRNFLFGEPGQGGLDLASLNIQRGRDHGISSYNDVRRALGLAPVTRFNQITSDADLATALRSTYGTVEDIDLWVGGLSEDRVEGSQLGVTFQALVVRQFRELRAGDRFWYERDLPAPLVDEINTTNLSDIIRRNTQIGRELQENVFRAP